jgi:hypothetical protein
MSAADRRAIKQQTAEEAAYAHQNKAENVQHSIYINWLNQQKWYEEHGTHFHDSVYKKRTGHLGDPDFLVCYMGAWLCLEFKTRTGRLSGEQVECHTRLLRSGNYVHIPTSAYEAIEITRKWRERVACRAAEMGEPMADDAQTKV